MFMRSFAAAKLPRTVFLPGLLAISSAPCGLWKSNGLTPWRIETAKWHLAQIILERLADYLYACHDGLSPNLKRIAKAK